MVRQKRKHSQSEGSATIVVGIVLLALLITGLVGVYAYFGWKAAQALDLDPVTFCPVSGPVSTTAVLLDLTEPVAKPTLGDIRNRFEGLMENVPEGGALAVFALTEHTSEIEEKLFVCNPGNGENVDPMTSNPRLAKKRWEESYRQPLDAFIEGLSNQASSVARSPIMAGIQQIELRLFNSPRATKGPKRLIVVSDMLEHTDVYSLYRDGAEFSRYQKSAARDMFRSSLQEVDVKVLFIQRLKAPVAHLDVAEFWAAWFTESRAGDFRIVRLAGAM